MWGSQAPTLYSTYNQLQMLTFNMPLWIVFQNKTTLITKKTFTNETCWILKQTAKKEPNKQNSVIKSKSAESFGEWQTNIISKFGGKELTYVGKPTSYTRDIGILCS